MSLFVSVRNVNPLGDVSVIDPVTGDRIDVAAGATVKVSPELAGRAPQWRPFADGEVLQEWQQTREHDGQMQVHDLGTGLLAQVGNWEPSPQAAAKVKGR